MTDIKRQFVTTTITEDGTVQQRKSENLYNALNCLTPISLECKICKVTKLQKLVTIIVSVKLDDKFAWAWRSRMDQEHNDQSNRFKLQALSEKTRELTNFHKMCCKAIEQSCSINDCKKDYENVKRLSDNQFNIFVTQDFEGFACSDTTKSLLIEFCNAQKKPKFNVIVSCIKCGRCKKPHTTNVLLDSDNLPYIECSNSKGRVDVLLSTKNVNSHSLHSLRSILYGTEFTIEDGDDDAIAKLRGML